MTTDLVVKSHQCPDCEYVGDTKSALDIHRNKEHKQNKDDSIKKKITSSKPKAPQIRLTPVQIVEIVKEWIPGTKAEDIARKYKVPKGQVVNILKTIKRDRPHLLPKTIAETIDSAYMLLDKE